MAVGNAASLHALEEATSAWANRGQGLQIGKWLVAELDAEGAPRRLAIEHWPEAIECLSRAWIARPDEWPIEFEAILEGFFRALLRFSRTDGSTVFGPIGKRPERGRLYSGLARRLDDPSFATVTDWWFPSRSNPSRHSAPPTPAHSRPDRVLASLRANWSKDGDFATIDHRAVGSSTRWELNGLGRTWLGPGWNSGACANEPLGRSRPLSWLSQSSADYCEWSLRIGKGRVTRSATLLRGRRIAILGELWEGPDDTGEMRIGLAEGVQAESLIDCRGLSLRAERPKGAARVYPIGLPRSPYETDRGSLTVEGDEIVLRQAVLARRSYRTLLVSWEPLRNRQNADWRGLTVSQNRTAVGPDLAFATRMRWGRDETLLIYRNLGKPSMRAFLGHQTRARFVIGLFSKEGDVRPLLQVDDNPVLTA